MPLKFDITLTAEDMYRFNMYQTYSGFHGWFSIAFSILIFVVAGVTRGKIEAAYTALYIVFGIVFLVYPPVSLYLRSKRTLAMSEVLRGTLHYEVDEEGLDTLGGSPVTEEQAKQIVQDKVPGSQADDVKVWEESGDGRGRFEGELYCDGMKYEFEIDPRTGIIFDWNADLRN